ncbi:MAG: lysine 2,3-aminomutase [Gammaproteobacteria bacterium]|nr:lysine 2,3-aminomutase [Gammaproteobacteria bacterium]
MSKILQFHRRREEYVDLFSETHRFKVYTERHLDQIAQIQRLPEEQRFAMHVVAKVLPFRVNQYVIDELIDWTNIPEDPIFQLTFPQSGMLEKSDFDHMAALVKSGASNTEIKQLVKTIRDKLNPHPAGQNNLNVPMLNNEKLPGIQHKYRETVLFFPSQGQTCHSYCTFCFRWAQFIGDKELRISSKETSQLHQYLRRHKDVSDLLMTGGDPMVMKTKYLKNYLEPLLEKDFEHIQNIRIGTKAISFWPQRFVSDEDADELLELFTKLVKAGKHVAIMTHFNHWREMETPMAVEAIHRLRATGAVLRSQSPLIKNINDNPDVWGKMWRIQTRLGIIPYYMFIERDTGAKHYFEVPLARAWEIYHEAIKQVSGLSRTVRGPSMSATPGKVEIQGITEIAGEKVFVCRFIQGRNPDWVQRPFFAKFDKNATWLHDLKPAFGKEKFFFEE